MPRERTADDKLLALLARMPAPMDTPDIAKALGWSRQNVMCVATRLERAERLVRIRGVRAEQGETGAGRPADAFALAGFVPTTPAVRPAPLAPDTVVVTPSGEEARVIRMRGRAFAEIEYITGPERFQRAELHVTLLRAFQSGRDRPEPVRVAGMAAKVAA